MEDRERLLEEVNDLKEKYTKDIEDNVRLLEEVVELIKSSFDCPLSLSKNTLDLIEESFKVIKVMDTLDLIVK